MSTKVFWYIDFTKVHLEADSSASDTLHYFNTVIILSVYSLILSVKQYFGKPIQCWVPPQFKQGWESYVETYCFIENTYYIPMHREVPDGVEEREVEEIGYYQWMPIVLGLQAICFYLPRFVWSALSFQAGKSVVGLIERAVVAKKDKKNENLKTLKEQQEIDTNAKLVAGQLENLALYEACKHQRIESRGCFMHWWFRLRAAGVTLTLLNLFVKLLYIGNVVGGSSLNYVRQCEEM